jgi:EAL domain-containing protein (putative c-di-GMP-specific phosphodiesterase class I)
LAEGVETSEHDALLKELGCDLLQGYLLARPMSAESLRTLISTSDFSVSESPCLALI